MQAAGLHRGDWHVLTGLPYLIRVVVPTLGLHKPKVPVQGMDLAGTVAAVGATVCPRPVGTVSGQAVSSRPMPRASSHTDQPM